MWRIWKNKQQEFLFILELWGTGLTYTLKLPWELQGDGKLEAEFPLFVNISCISQFYRLHLMLLLLVRFNIWKKKDTLTPEPLSLKTQGEDLANRNFYRLNPFSHAVILNSADSQNISLPHVCLRLAVSLRRPSWSPSRQTSSLGSSTSTCTVRVAPCTASSTTHSPTSTCPVSNPARLRRTLETSPSAGNKHTHAHTHTHTHTFLCSWIKQR